MTKAAADVQTVPLSREADAHTQADWEAAAAAVLRKARRLGDGDADASVWDVLSGATLDGIAVTPLGLPGGEVVAARPHRAGGWDIRSYVGAAAGQLDAAAANEAVLADLAGGATSLWVGADRGTDLARLLDGVLLDLAPVVLDGRADSAAVAAAFLALPGEKHADSNLGLDPLGVALATDSAVVGEDDLVAQAQAALAAGVRAVLVDGTAAHNLGASDGQELGWVIATATRYLRLLTASGELSVDQAAATIEFRLAATAEQFPSIAKFRALRTLWASVLTHSGAAALPARIHASTSRPMMSKYDPYVNMLRGTVAAFAAGVGGADAVTVIGFDAANGTSDAFARRIARNVNHLLIDEAHIGAVADPAGGSYAVEKLTVDLAQASWAEFQRLEAEWADGTVETTAFRARVNEVVAQREGEIARRIRPLTGVTEFPNLGETLPDRVEDPINAQIRRYGASFEALRDEPVGQTVFLATLGTVAQHTARATFATNLLAAGGIGVDVAGATSSIDDLTAAYAGQAVVMLAGSDSSYGEWGAEAAAALRAAGARHLIIAGKPAEYADVNVAVGVDALAFLTSTRKELGA